MGEDRPKPALISGQECSRGALRGLLMATTSCDEGSMSASTCRSVSKPWLSRASAQLPWPARQCAQAVSENDCMRAFMHKLPGMTAWGRADSPMALRVRQT